jgi:hypothetical protein
MPNNEKDTNPKDMIAGGKVSPSLVPSSATLATAMAFLEGALKYGRYNWRVAGVRASVYYDALNRHAMAWWNGEDIDPKSGLPHLYKMSACIAILIDADLVGKLNDDRPPRADVAGLIERLEEQVRMLKEMNADKNPYQYTILDGE